MTKQLLLSGLALATLALNACSSEPSDWRPDKKVSVDMVAPGTRSDEDFDKGTVAEPNQAKGGAIEQPISTNAAVEAKKNPTIDQATSANAEKVEISKKRADAAEVGAKTSRENTTKPTQQLKEE